MSDEQGSSVQRLVDQILADARRKAERAQKKADREAEKMTAKATSEAEAILARAREDGRERAEQDSRRTLASVPLEILRHRLTCQQAALDEVRQLAETEAGNQQGDARYRTLLRLTTQAAKAIDAAGCVVTLNEADRREVGDRLVQEAGTHAGCKLTLDAATAPIRGGVVVCSEDGRRAYDNSIEQRFARLWEDLRADVANTVYPPSDDTAAGGTDDDAGA